MSDLTLFNYQRRAASSIEARLVIVSASLLATLMVADRAAAWMIGEFPSSALAWQFRFEFLRPVGVFYDIFEMNLGRTSPFSFSLIVVTTALAIAAGPLSGVRLARALSAHILFAASLTLAYFCSASGEGIQAHGMVGIPSDSYLFAGGVLSLISAACCLRIHAEYMAWTPRVSLIASKVAMHIVARSWRANAAFSALSERLLAIAAPRVLAPVLARQGKRALSNRR